MPEQDDVQIETLAESENYAIWVSHEPEGETVFHVDVGVATLNLLKEEWDELVALIQAVVEKDEPEKPQPRHKNQKKR
jgi:hypothetical protein